MAWLKGQNRITQCYVFTAAALNDCGIRPDGAEIKPWIRDELTKLSPQPAPEEVDAILVGMIYEGVTFENTNPEGSTITFDEHPLFGKRGHKLGIKTEVPGA